MKKIFRLLLSTALIVSFMTVTQSVNAGNIDKAKARQVGAYFMASQFGDKAITATSLKEVYQYPNVELGIPALYVFNTPGNRGFVIISGTDCVSPVVAYSTDGAFDPTNIAPNLNWWLTDQAQPIIYAQNNNLEPLYESLAEWETLIQERLPYFGQDSKEIIRLTTSTWNQEPLYNNLCPIDNGGRCVTGCVATAMAQIMYYWQYPWVGKSVHGYYWYKNGTTATYLEANFGQTYYDYNNMVDALSTSSTQEQINACALLSYHCGVAVDMNYSSDASGSHDDKAKLAFYKYFKYNQDSIKLLDRSAARYRNDNNQTNPNYKDTLWVNDLKEHIMKKRPIYYSGYDVSGGTHAGHAFVCDGYNTTTKTMHFNWGWGGAGDCWCNVFKSNLNAMLGYHFTTGHTAIVGITPPADSIRFSSEGIVDIENPFTAKIYPNPAKENVTVSYTLAGNVNAELQILDITGREVKQVTVSPASSQVTISVAGLRPGVYICRLQGHSQKFIVQ